ncbi:transposase domain-containing protein [Thiopseudomonas alkaliphila]|uniref:transposase domain-containing protein n=1 Tax=Thiopseudomonas alkaliphila TaxID=1697053 RepID=UPI0035710AEC
MVVHLFTIKSVGVSQALSPQAYIKHILDHIAVADTLEKLEALLPWNVELG